MGLLSRGSLEPRRADVVPGAVDTESELPEGLRSANGKLRVVLKVVLAEQTGMQTISVALPMWVVQILRDVGSDRPHGQALPRALDVPVLVKAGSDQIKELDVDLLQSELEPYREAATAAWKQDFGLLSPVRHVAAAPKGLFRGLREVGGHLSGMAKELASDAPGPSMPRPTAATHPAIEGVDYDAWIRANVQVGRGGEPADQRIRILEGHGFPAGRAEEVDAAWWDRCRADEAVSAWYSHDYHHLELDDG